jgi:hypothetical protein
MSIRTSKILLATSALLFGGLAQADMSYSYVEGGYGNVNVDIPGDDVDGDGWLLGGSIAVTPMFYVMADFRQADLDFDVDLTRSKVGLGLNYGISPTVDLIGRVAWVKLELDTPIGDADDDGFGLDLGLRGQMTDKFEVEGAVQYSDFGGDGGDDTAIVGQARYFFTNQFALGGLIEASDDVTTYGVLFRLNFK